jgi:C_GCAxxG_C_C family probable redox protein
MRSSRNCAQAVFAALCEAHHLQGGAVLKALTPFPGLALRGETCGAVTGALMALGLVYGREDMSDWRAYLRSIPPARRFCAQFAAEHGGTACREILQAKLGRSYDLASKGELMKYAADGGPGACAGVVASAARIASKLINGKAGHEAR